MKRGMADYHHIKNNGAYLTPDDVNLLHESCHNFLQEACEQHETKQKVVVSHHVPTLMNYPPEYKGSILNNGFAVELYPFIEASGITKWIYGHHHRNITPFTIGSCELLTNQLGYVDRNEHLGFMAGKCLNLI